MGAQSLSLSPCPPSLLTCTSRLGRQPRALSRALGPDQRQETSTLAREEQSHEDPTRLVQSLTRTRAATATRRPRSAIALSRASLGTRVAAAALLWHSARRAGKARQPPTEAAHAGPLVHSLRGPSVTQPPAGSQPPPATQVSPRRPRSLCSLTRARASAQASDRRRAHSLARGPPTRQPLSYVLHDVPGGVGPNLTWTSQTPADLLGASPRLATRRRHISEARKRGSSRQPAPAPAALLSRASWFQRLACWPLETWPIHSPAAAERPSHSLHGHTAAAAAVAGGALQTHGGQSPRGSERQAAQLVRTLLLPSPQLASYLGPGYRAGSPPPPLSAAAAAQLPSPSPAAAGFHL